MSHYKAFFTRLNIEYFLYVVIAIYLAFDIKYVFVALQPQWQLIGVSLLILIMDAEDFIENISSILICGVLSAIFVFIGGLLTFYPLMQVLFLTVILFIAAYIGQKIRALRMPVLIMSVLVIAASISPANIIENPHRGMSIAVSLGIVLILQLVFLIQYRTVREREMLIIAFRRLKQLNDEIFNCYLQKNYKENLYLYERRIHVAKNNFFEALSKLESNNKLFKKFETSYMALIACAQLRKRVSDYSIFSVCYNEMKAIQLSIDQLFSLQFSYSTQTEKKIHEKMDEGIDRFEAITSSILQVSSREPLVFFLFIESLKDYNHALQNLISSVHSKKGHH